MGAVACMDLDNGLQRERSQSPKATWCVIPCIQNSQNKQKQKGGGQGWVYRESLEFPSGPKKVFGTRERSWACKLIDTVSATELHAVEWFVLCAVDFSSIFKKLTFLNTLLTK